MSDAASRERWRRAFADFLAFDAQSNVYASQIRTMVLRNQARADPSRCPGTQAGRRLAVSLDDLRDFSPQLVADLLHDPANVLPAFADALRDAAREIDPESHEKQSALQQEITYAVAIEGSFGRALVGPRQLNASLLNTLVLVEGVVTKCTLVRPQLVRSVHYCEATGETHVRSYRDQVLLEGGASESSSAAANTSSYPTKDDAGNMLTTEYGYSTYRDHQRLVVQEMPERAPAGQLPCSVEVICTDDLCDLVKPGDRVAVCGVYKAVPGKGSGGRGTSGLFQSTLVANGIRCLSQEAGLEISGQDIRAIKEASKRPDIFKLLAGSLAPSIYGHDVVKQALLLQLLGGAEKILEGGTRLRGDINILLVGDPSCGKSQLLRFVLNTAPLAVSTTGRGSSGVGLTAAVVHDRDSNDRRLEAGAMVLADRGIVCIDEFDKMSADDRTAIHEVMEQQTVTISKAGIHASLNARCAVLAASNPIYGSYNKAKKPTENIALPDSLLSRFDLLFIFLDELTPEHDRRISDHVLRMHRYRDPHDRTGLGDSGLGAAVDPLTAAITADVASSNAAQSVLGTRSAGEHDSDHDDDDDDEDGDHDDYDAGAGGSAKDQQRPSKRRRGVFQEFDRLLHGSASKGDLYSVEFVKKYLTFAKTRTPTLGDEARDFITSSYTDLRQQDVLMQQQQQQVGPRPPVGSSPEMTSGATDLRTLPVTARTLETIIRLATAHAKLRLSPTVDRRDAELALRLLRYALYHDPAISSDTDESHNEPKPVVNSKAEASDDEEDRPAKKVRMSEDPRIDLMAARIQRLFRKCGVDMMSTADLVSGVNEDMAADPAPAIAFTAEEANECLEALAEFGTIAVDADEGTVVLI